MLSNKKGTSAYEDGRACPFSGCKEIFINTWGYNRHIKDCKFAKSITDVTTLTAVTTVSIVKEIVNGKRPFKHPCHDMILSLAKMVTESETLMENDPAQFIEKELVRKLKGLNPQDLLSTDAVEAIIHTELSQLVDLDLMERIRSVTDKEFRKTKHSLVASSDEGINMFAVKAKTKNIEMKAIHENRRAMLEAELKEECELMELEIAMIKNEPKRRNTFTAVNVLEMIDEAYPAAYLSLAPKKRPLSNSLASQNANDDIAEDYDEGNLLD